MLIIIHNNPYSPSISICASSYTYHFNFSHFLYSSMTQKLCLLIFSNFCLLILSCSAPIILPVKHQDQEHQWSLCCQVQWQGSLVELITPSLNMSLPSSNIFLCFLSLLSALSLSQFISLNPSLSPQYPNSEECTRIIMNTLYIHCISYF